MVQAAEQPSPERAFSSSQVSVPTMRPSPQSGAQKVGEPEQRKPCSRMQVGEQPSPSSSLSSSQASVPATTPSPQVVTQ